MSDRHPRPHEDDPRDPWYGGHEEDRDDSVEVRTDVNSHPEPDGSPDDVIAEERPPAEG